MRFRQEIDLSWLAINRHAADEICDGNSPKHRRHGTSSPFTNILSNKELEKISSKELLGELHDLLQYRHRILYYGPAT